MRALVAEDAISVKQVVTANCKPRSFRYRRHWRLRTRTQDRMALTALWFSQLDRGKLLREGSPTPWFAPTTSPQDTGLEVSERRITRERRGRGYQVPQAATRGGCVSGSSWWKPEPRTWVPGVCGVTGVLVKGTGELAPRAGALGKPSWSVTWTLGTG